MKKWGVIAAVALLGLTAAGAWLALRGPQMARDRLEIELRHALGPETEIGALEIDGSAIELHGLAIEGQGLPLDARLYLDTLRVEGDLRSLAGGQPRARRVEVTGGSFALSKAAVRERVQRLLEGGSEEKDSASATEGKTATPSVASIQRRLARLLHPKAEIALRDFAIHWYEGEQLEPFVEDLDLVLREPLHRELDVRVQAMLADGRGTLDFAGHASLEPLRTVGRFEVQEIELAHLHDALGPLPYLREQDAGYVSARVDAFEITPAALHARGTLRGRGLTVEHASLHEGSLALAGFEAHGDATWQRGDGTVEIRQATATLADDGGRIHYTGGATLRPIRVEGQLAAEEIDVTLLGAVLDAIPWIDARSGARVSARLDAFEMTRDAISAKGAVAGSELVFQHEAVHENPVPLPPFRAEGEARLDRATNTIQLENAHVTSGEVALELAGALEWKDGPAKVSLEAKLPETDCGAALGVVPETLLGKFRGFAWTGRIGGALSLVADVEDPDASKLDVSVNERCRFESVPQTAQLARFDRPFEHVVRGHDGELIHRFRTGPGHPSWVYLDEVSPFLIHAVLAHEDAAFLRHRGFAPWAMESALKRNLEEKRFAYGASTISMQLAKNLFLERSKSLDRKLQEVLLTWWLEENLGKREILELYLNVIEYGPQVFGIRDAAWHYFGRKPSELSAAESAFLAAILPAPTTRHVYHVRGELSPWMKRQVSYLLTHMHRRDRIDAEALESALDEVETFRFREHGGDPLPPRGLFGDAAPLPFATAQIPRELGPHSPLARFRALVTAGSSQPRRLNR